MTIRLTADPIDPAALLGGFGVGRREAGAVVSFTGRVREEGGEVQALELQAYPGLTDVAIARMAQDAVDRFGLDEVLVVHRIGRVETGEAIVFVAASAHHRRAAFQAVDQLMDYLKSRAPFWKKSHETAGARWIEPTPRDHQDADRWSDPTAPPARVDQGAASS